MPAQTGKSKLMAKYGPAIDQAVRNHGGDETEYGRIDLPPGITNGVARLVECKFDTYKTGDNTGEFYFRAAGVVVEPTEVEHKGQLIPVAGQQTSIMVPVCQTKNQAGKVTTQEENVARILNEMRKLGADTNGAGVAEMEALADALKEAAPYFRFSTSQSPATPQFPNPRIWENWNGTKGLGEYVPPDEGGGIDDATPQHQPAPKAPTPKSPAPKAPALAPAAKAAPPKAPARPPAKAPARPPAPEPEPEETVPFSEFDDLESLLTRANDDDTDAQGKLQDLATAAGISDEDARATKTWDELVGLIRNADGSTAEANAEPEATEPAKGDVYYYCPVDLKTKKKGKKVEVEVTKSDKLHQTVDLLNNTDKKTKYTAVPWDALEGE